jgi:hypothetical protein
MSLDPTIIECLDYAIDHVWKRARRRAGYGSLGLAVLSVSELAIEVDEDLTNVIFDGEKCPPLPKEEMDYVEAELRKRGQRAHNVMVLA